MKKLILLFCLCFISISVAKAQVLTLHIDDNDYIGDDPVVMDVSVSNADSLNCLGFTITWDPIVLEFEDVGNFNLPGLDSTSFGYSLVGEGKLLLSWVDLFFSGINLEDGHKIFSIIYSPPCGDDGSTVLDFSNDPLEIEACYGLTLVYPMTESGTLNYTCQDVGNIYAPVFNDLNENAVFDAGEPYYPDAAIAVEPSGLMSFSTTDEGTVIHLLYGDYEVMYDEQYTPDWALTTSPSSYDVLLDDNNPSDTVIFGVSPTSDISNMNSYIFSSLIRCLEWSTFEVMAKNEGTTATGGTIWLEVDEEALELNFLDAPDVTLFPNIYGWHFEDLYPGHTIHKKVDILIPGPPEFPVGDSLNFESYVYYNDVNGSHNSDLFTYNPVVQCSFDPNDKQVFPNRPENYTLFGEAMVYTIRFQNTGNAEAYNVIIRDTLDELLDSSTFTFLSSSHREFLSTTLSENKYLTFTFNNIYLPDSTTNFDESQGFVSYKVEAKTNIPEGSLVTNRAGIYFDSNPPVLTNTTKNILISEFPLTTKEMTLSSPIEIFPNPTTGMFLIKLPENITNAILTISDNSGNSILKQKLEKETDLDLKDFASGIYFLLIRSKETVWIEKLVKF